MLLYQISLIAIAIREFLFTKKNNLNLLKFIPQSINFLNTRIRSQKFFAIIAFKNQ